MLWLFCYIVEPNTKSKTSPRVWLRVKPNTHPLAKFLPSFQGFHFPISQVLQPGRIPTQTSHQQLQLILASLAHWLLCCSGYYHVVPSRQPVAVFLLLHCLWFIFSRSWATVSRQEPPAMGSGASSTPTIWTLLDGGLETIGWWVQGVEWRAAKPHCTGICSLPPTTVSQVSKLKESRIWV